MQKDIIKYPDPTVKLISANVRFFNDELQGWISDMIDTMKAHDIEALSAILIGVQYNIIVIKENNIYTPYINARIIKHSGKATATERSLYYKGISVDVDRYERITIIYEDMRGEAHHKDLEGEAARVLQHQLDYSFGSTFVDRVDNGVKQQINDYLKFGLVKDSSSGSCPTIFYREYIKKTAKYLILGIIVTFIIPFFSHGSKEYIYAIEKYAIWLVPILIVVYFFYAQYEAKKYKQCTSCQVGNIIGSMFILALQFIVALVGVFIWMKP